MTSSISSPIDWKLWLPTRLGTALLGAGVGWFLSSVSQTSGMIPAVATGMMISFIMGGLSSWLNSQSQRNMLRWLATLACIVGIWAGAVNLAIAIAFVGALCNVIWAMQAIEWTLIIVVSATIGGIVGGLITEKVLVQPQP